MCRSAQNDGCARQTHSTPDLTLTLTPTHPSRSSRSALEVGRGSSEFTCKFVDLARTSIKCLLQIISIRN